MVTSKVLWSLFSGSGIDALPYAKAGWQCYCFNYDSADHGDYNSLRMLHPNIHYINCWIDDDFLEKVIEKEGIPNPDLIFAFPSCTFLAVSGAKHSRSNNELMISISSAKLVERLGDKFLCPWMVENPVGKMSTLWRKPNHYFHPYEYGGYLTGNEQSFHPRMPALDGYTKKTCIWCGNGFTIPLKKPVPHIGKFWGWAYLGGKSQRTKQLRSLTPRGWAEAVYLFNH